VFLLIFGTAGSLGDPLSEGKDVHGVEDILKRIEQMEAKMYEDERKFEQMKTKMNEDERKYEQIETKMNEDERKFEELELKIDLLEKTVQQLQEDRQDTDGSYRAETMMKTIEEDVHKNAKHIHQINKRVGSIEYNITEISKAEAELVDEISRIDANSDIIKAEVLSLNTTVTQIEILSLLYERTQTFGGNTYTYFPEKMGKIWQDAEDVCVRLGGHLASIHSNQESQFIVDLIDKRYYTWMGGMLGEDEKWSWTDGTTWDYTNWYPG